MTDRTHRVAAVGLMVLVAVTYLLRLDNVAGLVTDDAWYLVLAKALSTGEGFRLISSAATPILPAVPPGYPIILTPVWLVAPSFPENLWLFKAVSLLAITVVGAACFRDFTLNRSVRPDAALLLSTLVVLTPAFVFLATSTTMSECVFVATQMCAVLAVERAVRTGRHASAIGAGILVAATCLVRTTGFALAVAAVLYIGGRRRRQLAAFVATVAMALLPWQIYSITHQPTEDERSEHGGTIAYSYGQLLSMTRPGSGDAIAPWARVVRIAQNMRGVAARDVGAVLVPALYRGPNESGEEVVSVGESATSSMGNTTGTMLVSTAVTLVVLIGVYRSRDWLSLPVLIGAVSLGMIGLVGSQTFRYVLPLAPFLVLYAWRAVCGTPAARVATACLLGLQLLDHGGYLRARWGGTADWLQDAREVEEVLAWLRAGTAGAVTSTNPGLVFLRTGRLGISLVDADANWNRLHEFGVRYAAALRPVDVPVRLHRQRLLGKTARHQLWAIEIGDRQTVHLTESANGR